MQTLPIFYQSIVVLDRGQHRDLTLAPAERAYEFARGSHVVPALAAEFALGCRDMPIVFIEDATGVSPLFMVGMRAGRNDFIDAAGKWNGVHIPAYLRRYPFIGGAVDANQQVVCIDGGFSGYGKDGGARLFSEAGEPTEMLQRATAFVSEYADAANATAAFTAEIKKLDLLQQVNIDIRSADGSSSSFTAPPPPTAEQLNALPAAAATELRRKAELAASPAHRTRRANVGPLGDRAAKATA